VTGAASGIGRLMALKIATRGGRLILWDVNQPGLDALAAELADQHRSVRAYRCDLADREAIRAVAARVLEECGPVDVLINNAGIVAGKPLLAASDEEILRTFSVNTLATIWMVRAFLPAMLERGSGHIVNIASTAGLVGLPRLTAYVASKFAVVGFDEALRTELKRQGAPIVTTIVCPYFIDTGMFAGARTRFPWLLPILEPDYVAERVVDAVGRNRRRLILPRFAVAVLPLRLLPPALFDALMRFFGVAASMDEFAGRAGGGTRTTGARPPD
jgi:all-trans-retinol dehydrogenase (NAD+)